MMCVWLRCAAQTWMVIATMVVGISMSSSRSMALIRQPSLQTRRLRRGTLKAQIGTTPSQPSLRVCHFQQRLPTLVPRPSKPWATLSSVGPRHICCSSVPARLSTHGRIEATVGLNCHWRRLATHAPLRPHHLVLRRLLLCRRLPCRAPARRSTRMTWTTRHASPGAARMALTTAIGASARRATCAGL